MEFLGTFFFIFTIAMTGNPLAIAAMLMAWVYIGGYISGAHYNPAVTVAMAFREKLAWHKVPWYIGAQVLGGFVAYLVTFFLVGTIEIPAPAIDLPQAFVIEALLAFVLALVVLVVATSDKFKNSHVFGFAIGFTIPALAVLGIITSGGVFNPAIALGANLVGLVKGLPVSWSVVAMYVFGALTGGALAGHAFNFFFENEK